MITTHTDALTFLKSQEGFNEAMTKVVLNECFTFTEEGKMQMDNQLVQMDETNMRSLYEQMVISEIDVDGQHITVLGEPKYNLQGDMIPQEVRNAIADAPAEGSAEAEDSSEDENESDAGAEE